MGGGRAGGQTGGDSNGCLDQCEWSVGISGGLLPCYSHHLVECWWGGKSGGNINGGQVCWYSGRLSEKYW
jgi:hypothetical protein